LFLNVLIISDVSNLVEPPVHNLPAELLAFRVRSYNFFQYFFRRGFLRGLLLSDKVTNRRFAFCLLWDFSKTANIAWIKPLEAVSLSD